MLRKETIERLRRLRKRLSSHANRSSRPKPLEQSRPTADAAAIRKRLLEAKPKSPFGETTSRSGLSSGHEVTTSAGSYWLVRRSLPRLWSAAQVYLNTWRSSQVAPRGPGQDGIQQKLTPIESIQQHPDYLAFHAHFPNECIFLDLETCGFAGCPIFLAGVIHTLDGELVLSQLWGRNYAEERGLLAALREILVGKKVLITFNGKSFDWPQVKDRCIIYARKADANLPDLIHVDLLHLSRRRWKHQLTDCRLQTLERHICGRQRHDDVPGREIPDVYQHYVRTGDTARVDGILHHNALDLVTLLQLSLIVGQPEPTPGGNLRIDSSHHGD